MRRRSCTVDCSCKDVHEAVAVALWNLTFNPGNALHIVEETGVSTLVDLCSSSASKMARFMAALSLACKFDVGSSEVVGGLKSLHMRLLLVMLYPSILVSAD
ncbi:hypothetical protein PIB30_076977 [Stylosanthes scabra]|uniref:Uncharacterized protein n=1 Tax=Stylosanthes scabra TaxID=79078 RepID=A0ABU6VRM3_9FABA|nr:hypothetical protein [Stylosanthes scabra]